MGRILAALVAMGLIAYIGWNLMSAEKPIDARTSIMKQVEATQKEKGLGKDEADYLHLQLAITSFIAAKNNPPQNLGQLIPVYIDSIPKDPTTGEPYKYVRDGNKYQLGELAPSASSGSGNTQPDAMRDAVTAQVSAQTASEGSFVNPNTMKTEEFRYDPTDMRDPFEPFDFSKKKKGGGTPLQQYTLAQLRVTAILSGAADGRKAIVEDSAGRGYTIQKGTQIGDQNGVVVSIETDRVKVLESQVDLAGRESQRVVEMVIVTGGSKK